MEKGIDTTMLLGLIKEEDKEDRFEYKDESEDETKCTSVCLFVFVLV